MTEQSERLWALDMDKRARLLDPAEDEFIAHGYEGASLNRILASAKMSKGQAYYYISGKSDLYLAVCRRRFGPLFDFANQQTESLFVASDYWLAIEGLIAGLSEHLARNEKLSALALSVYGSASATNSLLPLSEQLNGVIERIIEIGQNAGEIRTDVPKGLIMEMLKGLIRSIDKWFALNSQSLTQEETEQAFHQTLNMVENLVKPTMGRAHHAE